MNTVCMAGCPIYCLWRGMKTSFSICPACLRKSISRIEERYSVALPALLRELTNDLCSSIGSLTNASKISRTLQSLKHVKVDAETISAYLKYLTESFLFSEAVRYDIK